MIIGHIFCYFFIIAFFLRRLGLSDSVARKNGNSRVSPAKKKVTNRLLQQH